MEFLQGCGSEPPPVLSMNDQEAPPLAAVSLSYRYPTGPEVLSGFSKTFQAGELVGITGQSGRGKSTLLYMLGLLLKPASGQVLVGGADAGVLNDRERSLLRATHFGFVFQDAALDGSRTVLDNVCETALYRYEPVGTLQQRAYELLDQLGVGLRATAKPGQVSGGQAQRIALARALVHEPRVLLCDEPTGNLDEATAAIVMQTLRVHAEAGGTVIVVTHSATVVDQCDREVRL